MGLCMGAEDSDFLFRIKIIIQTFEEEDYYDNYLWNRDYGVMHGSRGF